MPVALCPLYPILDASYLPGSILTDELAQRLLFTNANIANPDTRLPGDGERHSLLSHIVRSLAEAGVSMLQYRNKHDPDLQVLRDATWLRRQAPPSMRMIVNDRMHLVEASGCDGVHLGQGDRTPEEARLLLGEKCIIGLSTHDDAQIRRGTQGAADYLAIGPVYATGSKANPEAAVGLEGVRQARALTRKPLVAIGGITLGRADEVRAAGADSLAVISALFGQQAGERAEASLAKLAKDFLEVFR